MIESPVKERIRMRLDGLKRERRYFEPVWREVAKYVLGRRGRFMVADGNGAHQGGPEYSREMINNTPKLAARTLAAGLMAGVTSPARPWFKLTTPDPAMMQFQPVKIWLSDVERIMRDTFAKSNIYNMLRSSYRDLGAYGMGPMAIFESEDRIVRAEQYPTGSYWVTLDAEGKINGFYRRYALTVAQLVQKFGKKNVSETVKRLYQQKQYEQRVWLVHAIEEDKLGEPMLKGGHRGKPYRSVIYEDNEHAKKSSQLLSLNGFHEFPVMGARWDKENGDVYASTCPGIDALGDAKALQLEERRKAQLIDKSVEPPLVLPSSMKDDYMAQGGFGRGKPLFADGTQKAQSLFDNQHMPIQHLGAEIREVEKRIDQAFYADLFLMLANTDRRQITAREIAERHEEKLLMLGPVLESLHFEKLSPMIDRTFAIMQRRTMFPAPPQELAGVHLSVEYISVLAQAQQHAALTGIDRTATFVLAMAEAWPEARHKFDAEAAVEEYANAVGVPPQIIRDSEATQERVDNENAQAQLQQMGELAPKAARAAKDMSEVATSEGAAVA